MSSDQIIFQTVHGIQAPRVLYRNARRACSDINTQRKAGAFLSKTEAGKTAISLESCTGYAHAHEEQGSIGIGHKGQGK